MKPTQRYSIATLCIIGLIASWLAMAELLQDLQENYPKPFFLTYVIHSSYSFFLLVWLVWRYLPCQTCQRTNYLGPFKWGDYFAVSIWLSLFAFAAAYFWYLSLPRTRLLTDFMSLEFKSSWCHILQKRIKKLTQRYFVHRKSYAVNLIIQLQFYAYKTWLKSSGLVLEHSYVYYLSICSVLTRASFVGYR